MEILGNMKVLTILSRVLTCLRYQAGYWGCEGNQLYHYGRFAMLKLPFVAPKFRELKKLAKKGKNEKLRFAKKTLSYFSVFTS